MDDRIYREFVNLGPGAELRDGPLAPVRIVLQHVDEDIGID